MGQTIQELRGIITANITSFEKGIQGAIRATQQFRQDFQQAARDVSTAASRITAVVGGMATGVTAALVKTGVSFDDLKQRSLIAFETMLGSGQKARAFFDDLAKFAASTPFELRGLLVNVQSLMGMGFQAQQILPLLKSMGDAMSGMGKGSEDLNRLVMSFGQMQARGRITGEELREFAHNGIGALKMLADAAGTTTGEMQKLVEKGLIPADFAIEVITAGMNAKFGGMMQKMTTTFSGVLSNLKDFFDQTAGNIVEPLFNTITASLNDLYATLQGPQVAVVIAELRGEFDQLAVSFRNFFAANRDDVIIGLVNAFRSLIQTGVLFITWLAEATPAIVEFGREVWAVIQPVAAWVATHPQVLAWLALLKGAEMLGVLAALGSLKTLLLDLVPQMIRFLGAAGQAAGGLAGFGSAATSATSSVSLLRAGLVGLIAVGVAAAFSEWALGAGKVREEMKAATAEADRLNQKMKEIRDDKHNQQFADADREQNPERRARIHQSNLDMAEKDQAGLEARAKDARARVNAKQSGGRGALVGIAKTFGVNPDAADEQQAREAEQRAEENRRYVQELKRRRDAALAEAQQGSGGQGGAAGGVAAGGFVEGGIPDLNLPEKPEKIGAHQKTALDVDPEEALRIFDNGIKDIETDLRAFKDSLPEEQFRMLDERMGQLARDFGDGTITIDQFNEGARELGQNVKSALDFQDSIDRLRKSLSPKEIAGFESEFTDLLAAFQDGDLSADGFRRQVQGLNSEMRDAAEAADAAAKAKDRERLARGDFTAAEVQKAIQDRLISQQHHNLQQYVEDLLGLSQTTQTAITHLGEFSDGLHGVAQGMRGFAGTMNSYFGILPSSFMGGQSGYQVPMGGSTWDMSMGMTGMNSPLLGGMPVMTNGFQQQLPFGSAAFGAGASAFAGGFPPQMMGFVNNFKNFVTGALSLQNLISVEQQKLTLSGNPFGNPALSDYIQSLQTELANLRRPPPLFDRASNDWSGYAQDPGIAKGPSESVMPGGGMGNISIHLPNISRVTNADISNIADGLQREMRRRGSPIG